MSAPADGDYAPTGRYRWVGGLSPLLAPGDGSVTVHACEDCGAWTDDRQTHDRFHAILNHQARAIAVLVNAHLTERTHDRYDVRERIGDNPNNWSGEAFAEVVATLDGEPDSGRTDGSDG